MHGWNNVIVNKNTPIFLTTRVCSSQINVVVRGLSNSLDFLFLFCYGLFIWPFNSCSHIETIPGPLVTGFLLTTFTKKDMHLGKLIKL